MVIKRLTRACGEKEPVKLGRLIGVAILICFFTVFGSIACQKAAEEAEGTEESGVSVKEGVIEFEGTVKVVQGKYLYVPEAQGFDIVVQGSLTTGEHSSLLSKEVRGQGEFSPELPSILVAKSLEVKSDSGAWTTAFTLSEEVALEDYLDPEARDEFRMLSGLAYNKAEDWENLQRGKIQGKIEETEESSMIVLSDENERETGRIIVDGMSDFARYYIQKLGLFDRFWFYLDIKETVDWSTRRRTRELFHADVVFAGLF